MVLGRSVLICVFIFFCINQETTCANPGSRMIEPRTVRAIPESQIVINEPERLDNLQKEIAQQTKTQESLETESALDALGLDSESSIDESVDTESFSLEDLENELTGTRSLCMRDNKGSCD